MIAKTSFWIVMACGLLGCKLWLSAQAPMSLLVPSDSRQISRHEMEIIFVTEMEEISPEPSKELPLDPEIQALFELIWKEQNKKVVSKISNKKIEEISRWAKKEMAGFSLPDGWITKIPMKPLGIDEKTNFLVFGQTVEEGLELPSHHPGIVFRRLILRCVFDPKERRIIQIQVSIRGWAEE